MLRKPVVTPPELKKCYTFLKWRLPLDNILCLVNNGRIVLREAQGENFSRFLPSKFFNQYSALAWRGAPFLLPIGCCSQCGLLIGWAVLPGHSSLQLHCENLHHKFFWKMGTASFKTNSSLVSKDVGWVDQLLPMRAQHWGGWPIRSRETAID